MVCVIKGEMPSQRDNNVRNHPLMSAPPPDERETY